ncbi:hypothetical protein EIP91_006142 [Steccherinum ochraceum]|uniref:GRF-type domain-containing protein n=1 Tax=Steccherinum ochraceum TaxID=92696 RepID=A0A4R0RVG6_9APHY|nr:hypothetical protein EIP91_006142 [Steccherinum ochraceum]
MSQSNHPHRGDLVDDEGVVRCPHCRNPVMVLTSGPNAGHPGRQYFKCRICGDNPNQRFFYWADEPRVAGWGTPKPPNFSMSNVPSTPRPSQAQRAATSRGESSLSSSSTISPSKRPRGEDDGVAPATPSKRQATQSTATKVFTPAKTLTPSQKAKRLEEIAAVTAEKPSRPRVASGSTQEYATPESSQVSHAFSDTQSEYELEEKEIQTDPEVELNPFVDESGCGNSTNREDFLRGNHDPYDAFSDDEDMEVENAIQRSVYDPSVVGESPPVSPVTPRHPRQASHAFSEIGLARSGNMIANLMPTPPNTSQRPTRVGRASMSQDVDEDENKNGGASHTPTKVPSSYKGKEKAVPNCAQSDAQPTASTSRLQRQGSTAHRVSPSSSPSGAVTSDAVEAIHQVLAENERLQRAERALRSIIRSRNEAIESRDRENEHLREEISRLRQQIKDLEDALNQ